MLYSWDFEKYTINLLTWVKVYKMTFKSLPIFCFSSIAAFIIKLSRICFSKDAYLPLNPRRAAARRRTRRAGGCFNTPRLTRLMGHVATRGKRHSKERQKSWGNCFGHFLGQVKGQVTRGHQRSNFVDFNIFLQIGT